MFRIERWLNDLPPPSYPFEISEDSAKRGADIFRQRCFDCHDTRGSKVGKVEPIDKIQTDRGRLDSYTQFLLEAQQDYTEGHFWSFRNFKKTNGYANQPLDGIWARAPYLHNGSVPSMWALLTPEQQRPVAFTLGHDVYDQKDMGFQCETLVPGENETFLTENGEQYRGQNFVLDTRLRGNGNQGHSGSEYGTDLDEKAKRDLIEYLKWQDRPNQRSE